jgi:hypothetical protein
MEPVRRVIWASLTSVVMFWVLVSLLWDNCERRNSQTVRQRDVTVERREELMLRV